MLCDKCKKREAKVYYTEIIGGTKTEKHFCEECATQHTTFHLASTIVNNETALKGVLATIFSDYYKEIDKFREKDSSFKHESCRNCGMSYETLIKEGKFGCANCYNAFAKNIAGGLKNIQSSENHVGKVPKGYITETDRIIKGLSKEEKLSIKLQDAIEKEEFENAAKIRDLIREIRTGDETNA